MAAEPDRVLRPASPEDAFAVARIYNHYVQNTRTTFETGAVSDAQMRQRIERHTTRLPWLVAEEKDGILGYAYAAPWSAREGYRTTVETTVYVEASRTRRGVGLALYKSLIAGLAELGIHAAIGVIALPNPASVALHEKLGFRKAGEITEAGRKLGQWVNVGYWQLIIQRQNE